MRTPPDAVDTPTDADHRAASRAVVADGAALGGSALLSAIAGMVGWLIGARLLSQAEIGHAATFVNGFILVASVSELALGPALLRWLPIAGGRARQLVTRSYLATVALSLVVGTVWALVVRDTLTATLPQLSWWAVLATFVASCASWVVFHLQDEVLTGIGLARLVPVENLVFAVVRIGVLLWLAPRLGALGIIISWLAPTLGLVGVVSALLLRHLGRRETEPGTLPSTADVVRLAGPAFPAQIAMAVTGSLLQVIVTTRLGPETGAAFFVVWTGLSALDFALTGFGNSLVVQLARSASRGSAIVATSARRLGLVLLPALAVAGALAPWLLGLFGQGYLMAVGLLRLVLVGFVLRTVVLLLCAVHLARGRSGRLATFQGGTALALLVLVLTQPSLTGIGVGYVVVQAVMAVVAAADAARLRRREGAL